MGWRISVKNNKSQDIHMILLDQVPVPTLSEIELDVEESSRGRWNKETGEIRWELELDPKANRDLVLRYSVKYPRNQNLIFD